MLSRIFSLNLPHGNNVWNNKKKTDKNTLGLFGNEEQMCQETGIVLILNPGFFTNLLSLKISETILYIREYCVWKQKKKKEEDYWHDNSNKV